MLTTAPLARIDSLLELNTEPFVNERGLETGLRKADEAALPIDGTGDGELIVEDDYGRLWQPAFFRTHTSLLAGPAQATLASFANHGILSVPYRKVPRYRAQSRDELYGTISILTRTVRQIYPQRTVVYRGQTEEHYVQRSSDERLRLFGSVDALEPSLRPSGARRPHLSDPARIAWSQVVQRHVQNSGGYEPAHRFFQTGRAWTFATREGHLTLLAYAQHYGLPTPALDVTTDIGVALWFALHRLRKTGENALSITPATDGDGVLYIFAADSRQFFDHQLTGDRALRPLRQHGGFIASNWGNSKNRTAAYLAAAIYFPHGLLSEISEELVAGDLLFPGPRYDPFLRQLQQLVTRQSTINAAYHELAAAVYWVDSHSETGAIPLITTENIHLRDAQHDPRTDEELDRALANDPAAGYLLGLRLSAAGRFREAELKWMKAAEAGHLESATLVGSSLLNRGESSGKEWLLRAANAGQVDAMNNLGALLVGQGNTSDAEPWYRRAAMEGNLAAAYNLGVILLRSNRASEAERWLTLAANGGDPDAACALGNILYKKGSLKAAEDWLRLSADQGCAEAAYNLGVLHEINGDIEKALRWFGVAAEVGDPDAPDELCRLLGGNL